MNLETMLGRMPTEASRVRVARDFPVGTSAGKDYVLYWMQKAQRVEDNPALACAVAAANLLDAPLLVLFTLTDYPGANRHHYRFMLDGLLECAAGLRARGAGFAIRRGEPPLLAAQAAAQAIAVFGDEPRLNLEREWRASLQRRLDEAGSTAPLVFVETEAVVPPDAASAREEWAAATLRPKIAAQLPFYLQDRPSLPALAKAFPVGAEAGDDRLFREWDGPSLPAVPGDRTGEQRLAIVPGEKAALARFLRFIDSGGLARYADDRNDPSLGGGSGMSPYLHFGQVSPVRLARLALAHPGASSQAFVEQVVVRRELAVNFTLRNPGYDRYESAAPAWAREGLMMNRDRTDAYREADLEAAATQDRWWNAAQNELVLTGTMHNYMRMYWGKRVLAWHRDPAKAFSFALRMNDTYALDGRDPNGYAGVAWCFGKHDRPWPNHEFFGPVRSMVPAGLKRKFDIESYAERVESMYIRYSKEAP